MIDVEDVFAAMLLDIDAVKALVGQAVYVDPLPQSHDVDRDGPAITLFNVSDIDHTDLTGAAIMGEAVLQMDIYAAEKSLCRQIDRAILDRNAGNIQAVQGYRHGLWIDSVRTNGSAREERDLPVDGSDIHRHLRQRDFTVFYEAR